MEERYDRAAFHLFNLGFSGFSLLRMNDLIDPATGAARAAARRVQAIASASARSPVRFTVTVPAGVLGAGESHLRDRREARDGRPSEPANRAGAWTAQFCTPTDGGTA